MFRFRQWLARFMIGRYGMDELNRFLSIVTLVLIVLDLFVNRRPVDLLTVAGLMLLYFRMFSRNINARYMENQKFLSLQNQLRSRQGSRRGYGGGRKSSGFGSGFGRNKSSGDPDFTVVKDNTHKILRCPGCGGKLRVPKGAGDILISCPHCHTKFNKKV